MSSAADSLDELWLGGREGTLCPLESLKAFAFYAVYLEQGASEKKVFVKVAEKVTKLGGGHPGSDAIRKFIGKVRGDPKWYPGKQYRCLRKKVPFPLGVSQSSSNPSPDCQC